MSSVIVIGNYSIFQNKNTVTISLPQTFKTMSNSAFPVVRRRETLTDDELEEILLRIIAMFHREDGDAQ